MCLRGKIRKGEIRMLNDEICNLRNKLNKSIEDGEDYSIIYQLSVELDDLIANFYNDVRVEEIK